MDKQELRKHIRQLKAAYDYAAAAQTEAEAVFGVLKSLRAYNGAKNILLYCSMPDELPTHKFIDEVRTAKNIILPRINGDTLDLVKYDGTLSPNGKFAVLEPANSAIVPIGDIELAIVPGLAFDRHCNRLGRGRGYYDRLLSASHIFTIGVGFDFQFQDQVPTDAHDIPMNAVLTPSHICFRH